jgi:AcrR family transcriptional regulator
MVGAPNPESADGSSHTGSADSAAPVPSAPRTARERARIELTREIKEAARRNLEAEGVAGVSLRAVTRDLGMVSSAIYRYFASRDELLTALIIDAYRSIAATAASALEASIEAGDDHGRRWLVVCRSVREWALEHRQEWALVYGSPVVGYEAPQDTVEPAGQVALVLARVATDAAIDGALVSRRLLPGGPFVTDGVTALVAGGELPAAGTGAPVDLDGFEVEEQLAERALTMWISLIGTINFELFGHLHGVVTDPGRSFEAAMAIAAESIGLTVELD